MTARARRLGMVGAAIAALTSGRAHAQTPSDQGLLEPPVEVAPAKVETTSVWYGWQPLLADGVAVCVAAATARSGTGAGVALAGASYVLTPPVIHVAHDRGGAAAGSLALRVGMPVLMTVAVINLCRDCAEGAIIVGGGLGALTAMTIDAAALSWESVPVERPRALRVAPLVVATPAGDASVGVHGVF